MVSLSAVRSHNANLRHTLAHYNHTSLFIGATQGIGLATVEQLLQHVTFLTVYIVGRSASAFAKKLAKLKALNPTAAIHFIEAKISLLREVDNVCRQIATKERKLDLLFMSAGFLPIGKPDYTSEQLDTCFSVSYYSRMRFTTNMMPLLERAAASTVTASSAGAHPPRSDPRVFSVLNGGKEKRLITQDLGLKDHYSIVNVVDQTTMMTTLAFERLARDHPAVTFIHEHPGIVRTNIIANFLSSLGGPSSTGNTITFFPRIWGRIIGFISKLILLPIFYLIAISPKQSGERRLFETTTPLYKSRRTIEQRENENKSAVNVSGMTTVVSDFPRDPCGENGVYRVTAMGKSLSDDRVLKPYRAQDMPERIWAHTMEVFKAVTVGGSEWAFEQVNLVQ